MFSLGPEQLIRLNFRHSRVGVVFGSGCARGNSVRFFFLIVIHVDSVVCVFVSK